MTLRDIAPGERALITGFAPALAVGHREHLQAYGLAPGRWVRVVQHAPVTVVRVDETELAMEPELAERILAVSGPRPTTARALLVIAALLAPTAARAEEVALSHSVAAAVSDTRIMHDGLRLDVLPIELTAFGDVLYRAASGERGAFAIGSVEVDAVLTLYRNVDVSAAIAYDSAADVVRLSAITVDAALAGRDPRHPIRTSLLETSGLLFGKFDVPFGISYLKYACTENRLVNLAAPVLATHGGWNDFGLQAYAAASFVNAVAFVVNGAGVPATSAETSTVTVGGRVGIAPGAGVEVGGSVALAGDQLLYGVDAAARTRSLELENEYVARRPESGPCLHGFYSQALGRLGPVFAMARYQMLWEDELLTERGGALGIGVEVLSRAELRVVYERDFPRASGAAFVQLVAGSGVWQPTGLRR